MNIFNSLGSNYSLTFVKFSLEAFLFHLIGKKDSSSLQKLQTSLEKKYNKKALLTYKGRHAITLALLGSGLKPGDKVALQAFTCWAVEEAIHTAKMRPVYIDIKKADVNPGLEEIKTAYAQDKSIKALIVQHTFGSPAEIKAISQWASDNSIFVIEDLAHSFGTQPQKGKELGMYGDAVALSFGRDKIIDAISGGALLTTTKAPSPVAQLKDSQVLKDLLYPLLTYSIRQSYSLGFGKVLHLLLKKTPLLISPIANLSPSVSALPASHAGLALHALDQAEATKVHRQKITAIYRKGIRKDLQIEGLLDENLGYLRFPIVVEKRDNLNKILKEKGVYLGDTWYKNVVEVGSLKIKSSYIQGSCPNAEALSRRIYNLPTHIQITTSKAQAITKLVNQYA